MVGGGQHMVQKRRQTGVTPGNCGHQGMLSGGGGYLGLEGRGGLERKRTCREEERTLPKMQRWERQGFYGMTMLTLVQREFGKGEEEDEAGKSVPVHQESFDCQPEFILQQWGALEDS